MVRYTAFVTISSCNNRHECEHCTYTTETCHELQRVKLGSVNFFDDPEDPESYRPATYELQTCERVKECHPEATGVITFKPWKRSNFPEERLGKIYYSKTPVTVFQREIVYDDPNDPRLLEELTRGIDYDPKTGMVHVYTDWSPAPAPSASAQETEQETQNETEQETEPKGTERENGGETPGAATGNELDDWWKSDLPRQTIQQLLPLIQNPHYQ